MIDAIKNFFKGYVDFSGRSTRPDYWWIWLANIILSWYTLVQWQIQIAKLLLWLWA